MKKRYALLLLTSILFCFLLTSCGVPKPPKAEKMNLDLPLEVKELVVENPFDATNADVYDMEASVEIDKRQTSEKEDIVYRVLGLV